MQDVGLQQQGDRGSVSRGIVVQAQGEASPRQLGQHPLSGVSPLPPSSQIGEVNGHVFVSYQVNILQACERCCSYIWPMEKACLCNGERGRELEGAWLRAAGDSFAMERRSTAGLRLGWQSRLPLLLPLPLPPFLLFLLLSLLLRLTSLYLHTVGGKGTLQGMRQRLSPSSEELWQPTEVTRGSDRGEGATTRRRWSPKCS